MADAAFTPFPTINPTGAPRDYSNVRATPEEFGATVGQAESKMGAAVSQVGQTLFDVAKARAELQDELQANDLHSQKVNEMQSALSDFTKLQGDAANKALGGFSKTIGDITQTAIDGAPNLRTKALLSGSLRYTADRMLNYGRQHADTEFLQWQNQSATDAAATHANGAALAALHDNPRDVDISLKAGIGNIVKWGEQNYRDPKPLVQKYVGETISNIVQSAVAEGNLDKAQSILNKYKDQMDAGGILTAERSLKPALLKFHADSLAQDSVTPAGGAAPAQFSGIERAHGLPSGYLVGTYGIESNYGRDKSVSSAGAAGPFQFVPSTAAAYGLKDTSDLRQSAEAAARLAQDNMKAMRPILGRDPTAGELYLAHQQGSGGAIKLLIHPQTNAAQLIGLDAVKANLPDSMKNQAATITGGEFAQYWISHFNPTGARGVYEPTPADGVMAPKSVAYERIRAATAGNLQLESAAISRVNQLYTDWNTENADQQKNLRDNVPRMITDVESGKVDPSTINFPADAITNYLPAEEGNRLKSEMAAAVEVGKMVNGLRWASPEDITQIKEDLANGRGVIGNLLAKTAINPDEYYRLQSMGDARLTQVLKERQAQLGPGGDPGKFVQSNPKVDAAFNAIDVKNPKTYEDFARASLVVQHQLGVDFPYSHILGKDQAQDEVKNIIAMGAKAGDALDFREKQTGAAWPQVFHDLATLGKLPTEYQGMHILTDPGDRSILGKAIQAQVEDKKTGWAGKLGQGDIQTGIQTKKDIDLAISGGMSNYINSLRMSDASEQEIDSVQHAVRLLGYGNKMFKGSDSAATDAVKSFVGNYSYMVQGGARVPTLDKLGRPIYEVVNSNAQRTLEQLTVHDITLPEGVGQPGQPSAEAYLAQIKSAPMWITAKTGDRIYAKDMGGKWIRGADGNPISVMFSGPKAYESYTPKPDNYSGIINVYKKSLAESGNFTPEQVETMTRDYAKRFSSFGGASSQFNPEPHLGAPVPNKDDAVPSPSPENPVAVLGVRG